MVLVIYICCRNWLTPVFLLALYKMQFCSPTGSRSNTLPHKTLCNFMLLPLLNFSLHALKKPVPQNGTGCILISLLKLLPFTIANYCISIIIFIHNLNISNLISFDIYQISLAINLLQEVLNLLTLTLCTTTL